MSLVTWEGLLFTRNSRYCYSTSHASQFCLSVRPSAHPSIRPSHGWISQKRCKLGSPNLQTLVSGSVKLFQKFRRGHPKWGR